MATQQPRLPPEIIIQILDQLVGTRSGALPIAYSPSEPITKTLRSLTLASKQLNSISTPYLYSHCLYIDTVQRLSLLQRTFGFEDDRGQIKTSIDPYASCPTRNNDLADLRKSMTSLYLILMPKPDTALGLLVFLAPNLRRLGLRLDLWKSGRNMGLQSSADVIFSRLVRLEELYCSHNPVVFTESVLPNVKRVAINKGPPSDYANYFCSMPSLERLVMRRGSLLAARHINEMFNVYRGDHLDVFFIAVATKHATPEHTREFRPDDKVHIYELDVPISYYGDESPHLLTREWLCERAFRGTLWEEQGRKMENWATIAKRLAE